MLCGSRWQRRGCTVPTFERCAQCIAMGVPFLEACIVSEGAACDRCITANAVLSACKDHGWLLTCQLCKSKISSGVFCAACAWQISAK